MACEKCKVMLTFRQRSVSPSVTLSSSCFHQIAIIKLLKDRNTHTTERPTKAKLAYTAETIVCYPPSALVANSN